MRLVIIESPYAGDVERNVEYARRCVRDSLGRGEAPIASHLLYTQPGILNDDDPAERRWGIDAGLAWRAVAQASVAYTDLGISAGMRYGIEAAKRAGVPVEYRRILDPRRGASYFVKNEERLGYTLPHHAGWFHEFSASGLGVREFFSPLGSRDTLRPATRQDFIDRGIALPDGWSSN